MADLVEAAELAVRAARPGEAFSFDANGFATLAVQGHTWHAGRFETPSIAELLRAALECPGLQAPEVRRIMGWVVGDRAQHGRGSAGGCSKGNGAALPSLCFV